MLNKKFTTIDEEVAGFQTRTGQLQSWLIYGQSIEVHAGVLYRFMPGLGSQITLKAKGSQTKSNKVLLGKKVSYLNFCNFL